MKTAENAAVSYETADDLDLARRNVREAGRYGLIDFITCHEILSSLRSQYSVLERQEVAQ